MPITARTLPQERPVDGAGLAGFLESALTAPGGEFGPAPLAIPGVIYSKVGATLLRKLLNRKVLRRSQLSIARALGPDIARQQPDVVRRVIQTHVEMDPLVTRNLAKLAEARTGKPIVLVGFREQAKGGPVPGRGLFYSARPKSAAAVSPVGSGGVPTSGRSMDVIKLKNPYVSGGTQFETALSLSRQTAAKFGEKEGVLGRKLAQRMLGLKSADEIEKAYTTLDKWIARTARRLNYDGLIYKNTDEVVELGGTLKRSVGNAK